MLILHSLGKYYRPNNTNWAFDLEISYYIPDDEDFIINL
jgi:hypothetical protein